MKLRTYISITILLLLISNIGFSKKLSSKAEISIITCSPGNEMYSLFGHSAIRVKDPILRIDYIFNYGTFDFNEPNFYTKFAKGKLPYILSIENFNRFKLSYEIQKRSIYEQVLQIDSINKQIIWDALLVNAKKENRAYKYDFLFDNCATRVRDMVEKNNTEKISYSYENQDKTFRNILYEYLAPFKWMEWGISTVLGNPCDRIARPWEYMFIPDYLMYLMETANINGKKLTEEVNIIYKAPDTIKKTPFLLSPLFVFSLISLLFIMYSYYCMKRKIVRRWPDFIIFGLSGLVGALIFFLWFFTEHQTTGPNYNILYTLPTHLIVLFFLRKKHNIIIKKYFLINTFILGTTIFAWAIMSAVPQDMPTASIPLILLMGLRSYMISKEK